MPLPVLLGVPLVPVAINAIVGVGATIAATRLIGASTPTTTPGTTVTAPGSKILFWQDGISATEAAMVGAVGLAAFGMALHVSRGK